MCSQLEKSADSTDPVNMCDAYWFKKENVEASENYILQSVVDPTQYLCMKQQDILILSDKAGNIVLVTDIKKD